MPPRGHPWKLGTLRFQAKLRGISEQQEAPEVQGHGPPACGHALALYQLLPPSPLGLMGGSGEVGLASPPPPRYKPIGSEPYKWRGWEEGKSPSHPASEADCGPCWEGDCWSAGWERELPVSPALWWPPAQSEACGGKPSGTPQVDDGARSPPPPFIWGSVGGGGRGGIHPERLPEAEPQAGS